MVEIVNKKEVVSKNSEVVTQIQNCKLRHYIHSIIFKPEKNNLKELLFLKSWVLCNSSGTKACEKIKF